MAREVFADAWYFIALLEPRDAHHAVATRLQARTASRIVTHESVLTETLAYFSDEGRQARALAAQLVHRALVRMPVVTIDRPLFLRALDLYESRPDKEYSLVDCMSMIVMRERGITHVLTNDHHFRQEGFTVLSDAP